MTRISTPPLSRTSNLSDSTSIVVLEWVCGGGLLDTPADRIPATLLAEGQAMLRTLLQGLSASGLKVAVPLDTRLFASTELARIATQARVVAIEDNQPQSYLDTWCHLAGENDWSWLVAPELDDTLRRVAWRLRASGARLLNANDDFLRSASNKLICAELWLAAGIPHPPTVPLDAVDDDWLCSSVSLQASGSAASDLAQMRWVVKPADGAGGEGVRVVDRRQLSELKQVLAASPSARPGAASLATWIVQPWLHGHAASCSAVIDLRGRAHWLPLVSQDFGHANDSRPTYLGFTYPPPGIPHPAPIELLCKALYALPGTPLGWIGFDLLYSSLNDQWWIIEVNPRCTSSLVGLACAHAGNLVYDCYRLQTGYSSQLSNQFAAIVFRINNDSHH